MFTKVSHKTIEKLERLTKDKTLSTANEVVLYFTISRYGWTTKNATNPCMKSVQDLADLLGCSISSIKRSLKILREAGLVDCQYRTRAMGDDALTTTNWNIAQARMKRGAKQLRNYYFIKHRATSTTKH